MFDIPSLFLNTAHSYPSYLAANYEATESKKIVDERCEIEEKLKAYLSTKQINSYVLFVDDPNIATVDHVHPWYSNTPATKLFNLKGYTFHPAPDFPIYLGDQFHVTDEEKEIYPNGAYRVHMTLTSLTSGKSKRFTSNIIGTKTHETIVDAVQVERRLTTVTQSDEFGPYNERNLYIKYKLTLEDGTIYNCTLDLFTSENKQDACTYLSELKNTYYIHPGDKVSFADSNYLHLFSKFYYTLDLSHVENGQLKKYSPDSKIYRELAISHMNSVEGEYGSETRYKREVTQIFTVRRDSHIYTSIKGFGEFQGNPSFRGVLTPHTHFVEKKIRWIGYYPGMLNRVFIFVDEEGQFLFFGDNRALLS